MGKVYIFYPNGLVLHYSALCNAECSVVLSEKCAVKCTDLEDVPLAEEEGCIRPGGAEGADLPGVIVGEDDPRAQVLASACEGLLRHKALKVLDSCTEGGLCVVREYQKA